MGNARYYQQLYRRLWQRRLAHSQPPAPEELLGDLQEFITLKAQRDGCDYEHQFKFKIVTSAVYEYLMERGYIAAAPKAKPPEQGQVETLLETLMDRSQRVIDKYGATDWTEYKDLQKAIDEGRRYSELARGKGGK